MAQKFTLELTFSNNNPHDIARALHKLARLFDIEEYKLDSYLNPVKVLDDKGNPVGSWTYE